MLIAAAIALFVCAMLAAYYVRSVRKHEERAALQEQRLRDHGVRVAAETLWRDLETGGAAARTRYAGQVLIVVGHVETATPMTPDEHLVLLRTDQPGKTMQAMVKVAGVATAALEKPGAWVKLRCDTLSLEGSEPSLRDCVFTA